MRNIWHDIDPHAITPTHFTAVIEIPAGSKKKYELDKKTGLLRLDRILYTSTKAAYPRGKPPCGRRRHRPARQTPRCGRRRRMLMPSARRCGRQRAR